MYFIVILISYIFYLWNFSTKKFKNYTVKENPYTIRIIASNISLDRYYNNTYAEDVINELISISSPEKKEKYSLYGQRELYQILI